MDYFDFDLEVGLGRSGQYEVAVRSPAGEARVAMDSNFDRRAVARRLQGLGLTRPEAEGVSRHVAPPEAPPGAWAVQRLGQELFEALLTDEVRVRYEVSRRMAAEQDKGLRLKLRVREPELAALPWELMYDPRRAEYVCLSRLTPLVRYLDIARHVRPLQVRPPLRVLGMVSHPRDLPHLNVGREKQRVEEALSGLGKLIDLEWRAGRTWQDLDEAMQDGPWHVFHFIGHGEFDRARGEGCIALSGEGGGASALSAARLARLLSDHRPLRLVVLNSCEGACGSSLDVFSSTSAVLVGQGIPAVLAMQREISDRSAINFSHAFYRAVAGGSPVDEAVAAARKAMSMQEDDRAEWATPVLYMRAPDGRVFDIERETGRPEESAPPLVRVRGMITARKAVIKGSGESDPRKTPRPLVDAGDFKADDFEVREKPRK